MPSILITGASRGIGLEFARQYRARGWRVYASCRDPDGAAALQGLAGDGLSLHALDVTDAGSVAALAKALDGQPLDILLNNAGQSLPRAKMAFGSIDYDDWARLDAVNTHGPMRMAEAFLPHVLASEQKVIAAIGSTMGALSRTFGGAYAYRCSKAALHMAMASLAKDLREQGAIVALLSPGVVDTDLTWESDFPKITPEESVSSLIPILDKIAADPALSGRFLRYTGEEVAW